MDIINRKSQIIKKSIQEHKFEYLAIFISAFTVFAIIWPVIFAVHDDIFSYAVVRNGDILKMTINSAQQQGRFWFLVSMPISYFPFVFNNVIIYKFISYCSICFSVGMLGILISRNVAKEGAFLSAILFFTFAQLDKQHNLLVCYVFTHQIAIGFILLSIERLLLYYKIGRKRDLITSSFLLFFSTILYESFILFSLFLLCISLLNNKKSKKLHIHQIIFDLRFHIVIMLTYLLIYFIWRYFFPGNYDGAQFQIKHISDSLDVILTYGLARVPLVSTMYNYKKYNISMIEPIFIVKGLIVAVVVLVILKRAKYLNRRVALFSLSLCILGIFLPVLLHSITPKYVEWVRVGSYAYLPSFYSYFFITTFLSIFTILLYQLLRGSKLHKILIIFMFFLIFSGSIFTDINNKMETKDYQVLLKKYKAFDNAVSSEYFQKIENDSMIYIPDYNGIHNHMPYMEYYASIYSDRKHIFTNKIDDLTFDKPTYGFHYDEETGDIIIGKLKNNLLADSIYVVLNDKICSKTLILNKNKNNTVESSFSFYGEAVPINSTYKHIEIQDENIDIFSSYIVERIINNKSMQNIILGDGFHNKEIWGKDIAYWSKGIGKFILYNTFDNEKYVTISAKIASGDNKKPYELTLSGVNINQKVTITSEQQEFTFKLLLQRGKNEFTFSCDAPRLITTNGDTRELVFYVINFNMKYEEE